MSVARSHTAVVTGHSFPALDIERSVLDGVATLMDPQPADRRQLLAAVRNADAIMNQNSIIDAEVIAAAPHCRVIVPYGIGVDKIDIEAATAHGIQVCNVPHYCIEEVAIHTLALLLGFERGIARGDARIRAGHWDHPARGSMRRLSGRTLGLLGFGRIARTVAGVAKAMQLKVIAHDPMVTAEEMQREGVESVQIGDLALRSQYISIHCPLTPQTRGLIDAGFLAAMRNDAVLINASRGRIIQEAALVDALAKARIRGAALDVFEVEPTPADNPLLTMENVMLAPHVAWYSDESQDELKFTVADEVRRVLTGIAPRFPVNTPVVR